MWVNYYVIVTDCLHVGSFSEALSGLWGRPVVDKWSWLELYTCLDLTCMVILVHI